MRRLLSLFGLLWAASAAHADVRLHPLFADHAVLQRDREIKVFGWAESGEKVTVSLGSAMVSTTTPASGKWQLSLPKRSASTTPTSLVVQGKNRIERTDILIGDVWLCSGQSNMEWGLGGCDDPDAIRSSGNPLIRHFGVEMLFARDPQETVKGSWAVAGPSTSAGFTAVGYYFARKVTKETGVPIGLLRSSVGGTNIECWMRQETLLETPALKPFADRMRTSLAQYQVDLRAWHKAVDVWVKAEAKRVSSGADVSFPPEQPRFPFGEQAFNPRCVTLHNGMIAPLGSFQVAGVLWYQGENNAGNAFDGNQYIEKQRAMITDWRTWFGTPQMPFYSVQLAGWQAQSKDPSGGDGWSEFRDAQRRALAIPFTGMASAVDVGDVDDIHPKNKLDVGERMALWALRDVYGRKDTVVSGPLLKGVQSGKPGTLLVAFDHVDGGLTAGKMAGRGKFEPLPATAIGGFAIAGDDKVWHRATAAVDGDGIVLSAPGVTNPKFVRYGYRMNPLDANLYNKAGLPASPFRTDPQ